VSPLVNRSARSEWRSSQKATVMERIMFESGIYLMVAVFCLSRMFAPGTERMWNQKESKLCDQSGWTGQ
jgi:hypothetical protein